MNNEHEKHATKRFLGSAICLVLFLQTIIVIKYVDVDSIGPKGTDIGLSHMNRAFHEMTGVSYLWYDITTYLGLLAILAVAVFAWMGLIQWIKRRNILKVDNEILIMGGLYLFIFLMYAFFEIVIVNYRPVLMPGETMPEASFPSSHTVMTIVVMISVIIAIGSYVKRRWLKTLIQVLCLVVTAVMVLGRLFCGVHWLTDITAGTLISASLLLLFWGLISKYAERR